MNASTFAKKSNRAPDQRGRFFCEGEGAEGRDGAVEGVPDVGSEELETDRAEEGAEHLG